MGRPADSTLHYWWSPPSWSDLKTHKSYSFHSILIKLWCNLYIPLLHVHNKKTITSVHTYFKTFWHGSNQLASVCTHTHTSGPWSVDGVIDIEPVYYFIDRQQWQCGFGYWQFTQPIKPTQCTSRMTDHGPDVCVCVQTLVSWLLPCQNVLKQVFTLVFVEGGIHNKSWSRQLREQFYYCVHATRRYIDYTQVWSRSSESCSFYEFFKS